MVMFWAQLALLVVLAAFGLMGFVAARQSALGARLQALAPYQGVVGVIALAWGLLSLIRLVANLGVMLTLPLQLAIQATAIVVHIALGLILGLGLLRTFAGEAATSKLDSVASRLAPFQAVLGAAALALALWSVLHLLLI